MEALNTAGDDFPSNGTTSLTQGRTQIHRNFRSVSFGKNSFRTNAEASIDKTRGPA
jgi:hypothetical protein